MSQLFHRALCRRMLRDPKYNGSTKPDGPDASTLLRRLIDGHLTNNFKEDFLLL